MYSFKGCFTAVEVADHFGVPISTARLAIDRLKIGHRFNRSRVVYAQDFDQLATAFKMGYEINAGLPPAAEVAGAEEAVAGC
jgi:hypothetical protein